MSRWSQMDRDARIGAVFRLARQDKTAVEIAELLWAETPHVHALCREEGIVLKSAAFAKAQSVAPIGETAKNLGDIWGWPEAERRHAFAERSRTAARERLAEIASENGRTKREQEMLGRKREILEPKAVEAESASCGDRESDLGLTPAAANEASPVPAGGLPSTER